jgi:3-oxoadipate enol-lactonase
MTPIQIEGRPVDVVQHGSGPDLLLLHSLLADRSSFGRVMPELALRYRVTAPNLPGYGATAPLEGPVSIARYAQWVAALIEALALPPSTAVLGNGFGGFIAVALAAGHGRLFGKLIVADAGAGFPPAGKDPLRGLSARVKTEGMQAALDIAVRRMFPETYIAGHPEVVSERREALATAHAGAFQQACLALANVDMGPALPSIASRTLVIVGAEDLTTPPAMARTLAAGIPGSTYVEIPGCGHCPQIQKPDDLLAAIERFLAA